MRHLNNQRGRHYLLPPNHQLAGKNNNMEQASQDPTTFYEQFYIYEFQSLGLLAGDASQDSINIQSDADFIWLKSTYQTDIAGAAQTYENRTVPLCTIQIRDTGSGRNFFDAPIPITNLFGTGEIPFILPVAQELRLNSVLQCDFQSLEAAQTLNIRLALVGFKKFRPGDTPNY